MDRITPIPSPTLPAIAIKPKACEGPILTPLPEQDAVERNSLITIETWQNLFKSLPPEMVSMLFAETLFGLTVNEILNISEYQKGKLKSEVWPALYKANVSLFISIEELSEWCSDLRPFQSFVNDAQTYGRKTLRQIFYGFGLLKKVKSFITVEDCMRAGIISRELFFPDDMPRSAQVQQHFLSWLREKKGRILACLRWIPPQTNIPNLLEAAAKYHHFEIFKQVHLYTEKYNLYTAFHHPYRNALRKAVQHNDRQLTEYIINKFSTIPLEVGLLKIAARNGYFSIVELLIQKGANIDELDTFKRTALQTVIQSFYPHCLSATSKKYKKKEYQETLNQLDVIIFLLRQYVDKGLDFNINLELREKNTFLHMACYVQDPNSALWLARFILKQQKDKNLFDAKNADGKTPLMCALATNNYSMFTFLQEQRAKRVSGIESFIPLSLEEFQALRAAQNKASSAVPSANRVLPVTTSVESTLPTKKTFWLRTWIQVFADLSKSLLRIVRSIPYALYTFYLDIIRAHGKQS